MLTNILFQWSLVIAISIRFTKSVSYTLVVIFTTYSAIPLSGSISEMLSLSLQAIKEGIIKKNNIFLIGKTTLIFLCSCLNF